MSSVIAEDNQLTAAARVHGTLFGMHDRVVKVAFPGRDGFATADFENAS
jgi:hypothetical protein